jgi:hypothetical protein
VKDRRKNRGRRRKSEQKEQKKKTCELTYSLLVLDKVLRNLLQIFHQEFMDVWQFGSFDLIQGFQRCVVRRVGWNILQEEGQKRRKVCEVAKKRRRRKAPT